MSIGVEGDRRISAITGLGAGFPPNKKSNVGIAEDLGRSKETIDRLMRGVGTETRNWVTPGEEATSDLSVLALRQAFAMAEIQPSDLKSLVVATSTPDYLGVPTAAIVQEKLELPNNVRCYDMGGNACTGFLQALYAAFADMNSSIGRGEPQAVVGAEVISPILTREFPLIYPIFGDGAGAVIVQRVIPDEQAPTRMGFAFGADGAHAKDLYVPAGGSKNHTTAKTVADKKHTLYMNGSVVREQAVKRMAQMLQEALLKADMPIEEVAYLVPHQANLQIMRETAEALNYPWERVIVTIDHTGNTSAASIPIALHEAVAKGIIKRNDVVAMVAFGAGLEFAAAAIPMVGLPRAA